MFRLGVGLLIYGVSALSIYWLLHIKSIYDTVYKIYEKSDIDNFISFDSFLNVIIYCPVLNTFGVIEFIVKGIFFYLKRNNY